MYLATKRLRMSHDHPRGEVVWEQLLDGVVPDLVTDPADQVIVERYGPVVSAGPDLVLAQLAQSLDGFIARSR